MIKVKSLLDVDTIINQKLNVYDAMGHMTPYIQFLSLPLINIVLEIQKGNLYFQPEY